MYLAALRRAQMEIDLRPEAYKHYHLTGETFEATRQWTQTRNLFGESEAGSASYEEIGLAG